MVEHGLQCRNSSSPNPNHVDIGSAEIIGSRKERRVPVDPGGGYADYVPFYFTPWSIMMYNIKTGYGVPQRSNDELLICVASLRDLESQRRRFVFTNQHACSGVGLEFSNDLLDLGRMVDWALLKTKDFKKDPDDPGKLLRYQAEAMVHGDVPLASLKGIACHSEAALARIRAMVSPAAPKLPSKPSPTGTSSPWSNSPKGTSSRLTWMRSSIPSTR
jgi:hypothetical protein